MRKAIHFKLEGEGDQSLDFLSGVTFPLGSDFDFRRGEIGVCVYGHSLKRKHPADRDKHSQRQNQKALAQGGSYNLVNHSGKVELPDRFGCLRYRCNEFANCKNRLPFPIT
jgi:hypothetical protein